MKGWEEDVKGVPVSECILYKAILGKTQKAHGAGSSEPPAKGKSQITRAQSN